MTIDLGAGGVVRASVIKAPERSWGKVQIVGTPQSFSGKSASPDDRDAIVAAAREHVPEPSQD